MDCSSRSGGALWSTARKSILALSGMLSACIEAVEGLISSGSVPVVASIAPNANGVFVNVNADTAAAALAVCSTRSGWSLTDVEGLYRDWPNSSEVITELSATELRDLMPSLESGMAPKMEAPAGYRGRADASHRGRRPGSHALLLEIFTNVGIGTMVTQDGLVPGQPRVLPRRRHPATGIRQRGVRCCVN